MRKLFLVILIVMFVFVSIGCSDNEKEEYEKITVISKLPSNEVMVGNIPCNFPLVQEDTTLKILITGYENYDAENTYVWQKYEKMTGVNVDWTTVEKSKRNEAVVNVLDNNSHIDLIMRCKVTTDKLNKYGQSGKILDLNKDGLLEKYAPNCWNYLQNNPDTLASIMNPDGTIYSLPQINSGAELRVSRKIFINKNWLEKVNMEIPTTTEELYLLLKSFYENDANNNGIIGDEIPLCSADWTGVSEAFMGAYGLANRGAHNYLFDCDESTGSARFFMTTEGYKDFLEFFNRLYEEKLIDNNIFSMNNSQLNGKILNDLVGCFVSTNLASIPVSEQNNWIAITDALEGPNGDKLWTAIRANFHSVGAALIPTTCSNPELVLKWLDYFWTDEGTLFYHMGIENETFRVNSDGSISYLDFLYEKMVDENKSFDDIIAMYSPYPGGSNPTVEISNYFDGGEMDDVPAKAALKLFTYGPKIYWPSFNFTKEESKTITLLQSDIIKYCNLSRNEFIIGTKDLSEWDNYVQTVNSMSLNDLQEIYQNAINRYNEMQK